MKMIYGFSQAEKKLVKLFLFGREKFWSTMPYILGRWSDAAALLKEDLSTSGARTFVSPRLFVVHINLSTWCAIFLSHATQRVAINSNRLNV